MTPPRPAPSAESTPSARLSIVAFGLLGAVAAVVFGLKLGDASFVDEYAYISQSYYTDLFLEGRTNDPAWLEFPAYDLVPLPKYLIGLALRAAGERRPGPEAARAWYADTHSTFGPPRVLTASRLPSILTASLGCVALAMLGTLAFDLRAGLLAGLILIFNPLYSLHAHRAMSEAPCETFLMLALAAGMVAWKSAAAERPRDIRVWAWMLGAGAAVGLSVLSKFNGLLGLMTLGAWAALMLTIPFVERRGRLAFALATVLATIAAGLVFTVLDPFMTARPARPSSPQAARLAALGPWARFRLMIDHRRTMSAGQQEAFPHNALTSLPERAKVVAVQGFGRFGPLGPSKSDSEIRYDLRQDWGAFAWLPIVLAAFLAAVVRGGRQFRRGEPPTAWAVATWALVSLAVVTLYLPMAWDRYLLPIQAPSALLAAGAIVAACDGFAGRLRPQPSGAPR